MSTLTDIGRISYNGFVFPTETHTVGALVLPQLDEAKRTVIYNKITLTIKTMLRSTSLDAALSAAAIKLTHPGMAFSYSGRGSLPLSVNINKAEDVLWGPIPELVEMQPLGGGNACWLTWRVSMHVPLCSGARYTGPMEFNFRLGYAVAPNGNTRRVYSGHLVVANNRSGDGRDVRETADVYRDDINPALLPGFRRTPGEFDLSLDKSRLDFSIVDEQMGANIPPPNAFDVQADHTLASDPRSHMITWNGTLNATYELAKNGQASVSDARLHFFTMLKDRLEETRVVTGAVVVPAPGDPIQQSKPKETPKAAIIPIQFIMSEPEIFTTGGQRCRFTMTYQVVNANLKQMLSGSGLWRPSPNSDWKKWVASLGNVLGPRGTARLTFDPKEDRIHDLCQPQFEEVELSEARKETIQYLSQGPIPTDVFLQPDADNSWLHYTNALRIEVDDGTIPVPTLPKQAIAAAVGTLGWSELSSTTSRNKGSGSAFASSNLYPISIGSGAAQGAMPTTQSGATIGTPFPNKAPSIPPGGTIQTTNITNENSTRVQKRKPQAWVYMTGIAIRARFDIPCPELTDVNGVVPVPANRPDKGEGFWSAVISNCGWPIVAARWNLRYFLADIPTGPLPTLPNPLTGFTG